MSGKLAFAAIVAACALCFALVGCDGTAASSAESGSASADAKAS